MTAVGIDIAAPPPRGRGARLRAAWRGAAGFRRLWAASLGLPLVVLALAALWAWSGVEAEARARLARTVDLLHEHAARAFETQEVVLASVLARIEGMDWDAIAASREVRAALRASAGAVATTGGFVLVRPDLTLAMTSASPAFPAPRLDLSERAYLRAHRDGARGTLVGEVVVARPSGSTVFTLSRAREAAPAREAASQREAPPEREAAPGPGGAAGAFDGVAATSFAPRYFEDFYATIAEGAGDVIGLFRADGRLLARHPSPAPEAYARVAPLGRVLTLRDVPRATVYEAVSPVDGARRLYGVRWLKGYPVFVAYGLDPRVPRRAFARALAPVALVALASMAVLGAFTLAAQRASAREREARAGALAAATRAAAEAERAAAEAGRRALAEGALRRAERLEAVGLMVGGVAHDFANVVQSVAAGAGRLARRAGDEAEVRRVSALIEAAAERGRVLASRLLGAARPGAAAPADLPARLAPLADWLGRTLTPDHPLAFEAVPGLPPAAVDAAELELVVTNLVVNARDASPPGAPIRIVLDARAPEAAAPGAGATGEGAAPAPPAAAWLRLRVIDRGAGMGAEALARAGEAFFTTKPDGQGTGLGLSMARGFAERAGGHLALDSAPSEGTTATLWLPAAGDGAAG